MEIKKVLLRKDGIKYIIIPKNSEIKDGDFVSINKVGGENDRKERVSNEGCNESTNS